MPKRKKDLLRNDFPALTQLLEEIARHREHERVQPRLPFETPLTGPLNNSPRGRPAEKKTRRNQESAGPEPSTAKARN